MILRLAAVALALGPAALAAGPASEPGEGFLIYTGQAEGAGTRRACHACHGRDGGGGREGDVPAIRRTDLSPDYDPAAFHRALTEGVTPAGRTLSRVMPRYELSAVESQAVFAYIARIETDQRRGIGPTEVVFGVPVPDGVPSAWFYIAALRRHFAESEIFGRRLLVRPLKEGETGDDVAAVMGLPPGMSPARYTARGVPVLFPLGILLGDEDASVIRDAQPAMRDVLRSVVDRLGQIAPEAIDIVAAAGDERVSILRSLIRLTLPEASVRIVDSGARSEAPVVLVLAPERDELAAEDVEVPPPARVILIGGRVPGAAQLPPGAMLVVTDPIPSVLSRATGEHPLLAHARLASFLVVEALKLAGRDLTRRSLVDGIDGLYLPDLDLDYDATPLTGTTQPKFASFSGRLKDVGR